MEDYLKDFEFFGFNSELEMVAKIVSDANNSSEKVYDESTEELVLIKDRPFGAIVAKWFDDNEPKIEVSKEKNHSWSGPGKPFINPGIIKNNN